MYFKLDGPEQKNHSPIDVRGASHNSLFPINYEFLHVQTLNNIHVSVKFGPGLNTFYVLNMSCGHNT